jgi:hypothetical protein
MKRQWSVLSLTLLRKSGDLLSMEHVIDISPLVLVVMEIVLVDGLARLPL